MFDLFNTFIFIKFYYAVLQATRSGHGVDAVGNIFTPGGVQLRGLLVDFSDSDSDTDSEVSPGPAAWWAFWYVPFQTLVIYIFAYVNFISLEKRPGC